MGSARPTAASPHGPVGARMRRLSGLGAVAMGKPSWGRPSSGPLMGQRQRARVVRLCQGGFSSLLSVRLGSNDNSFHCHSGLHNWEKRRKGVRYITPLPLASRTKAVCVHSITSQTQDSEVTLLPEVRLPTCSQSRLFFCIFSSAFTPQTPSPRCPAAPHPARVTLSRPMETAFSDALRCPTAPTTCVPSASRHVLPCAARLAV